MAIFGKKTSNDTPVSTEEVKAAVVAENPVSKEKKQKNEKQAPAPLMGKLVGVLLQPRISEKAAHLSEQSKYVFTVSQKANKVSIRNAVEKFYGVKVARVNIIRIMGKARRYGKTQGKTSDYKKAIVTLTPNSKNLSFIE